MSAPRPASSRTQQAAAALCVAAALAGGTAEARKPPRGPVTVALPGSLEPYAPYRDPVLSPDVPWSWLLGRGLMRLDDKGRLRGDLAIRAATPDDGFTWDFPLRSGVSLADGTVLTPERFCDLWRLHLRSQDGIGWLFREVDSGPMPVGSDTVRFRLAAARPWFPWRLAHPWTTLVDDPRDAELVWPAGDYRVDSLAWSSAPGDRPESPFQRELRLETPDARADALLLMQAPAAGGGLLLEVGDAVAARLRERDLGGRSSSFRLACARGATRYVLLFQSAGVGDPDPVLRRRLVTAVDRSRLARRAAPATGRPLAGTVTPDAGGRSSGGALGGLTLSVLVDGEDPVSLAIADQMQADLLERGVDLRIEAAPGLAYDRRLREGHYGVALAGFRQVFGEPGLDLAARIRAAGLRTREVEEGLSAVLSERRRSARRRRVAQVEALLEERLMMTPLIETDECWARARGVDMKRTLSPLTTVPAGRFAPRRLPGRE